ncbi:hypothetical protein LY78DRAFT_637560 [Colletotrichum sublineola]|nr:hypothetical protein LY78DRAFT_637560 [Colletotrichum sublineola]
MFSRNKDLSHMSSLSGLRSRFKNSMSSSAKIRSSEGCWTCRLRRKKCDEVRPVCDGCAQLEITCYYSDVKPDWMDGGERQKEMADSLKKQVKIQANNRRERKYLQSLDVDGNHIPGSDDGDQAMPPVPPLSLDGGSSNANDSNSPSTVNDTPGDSSSPAFHMGSSNSPPFTDDSNLTFLMIYLDYVFPFLFPFYKPALLEGGRGWLLNVLNHNKALYHTALGLSSHFFGVVLTGAQAEHAPCRMKSVASLQHQLDLALRELRADMARINEGGVDDQLRQGCRVLESIVQLLIFDVTIAANDHWHMHLDAATVVFQQILPRPDRWDPTMDHMAMPLFSGVRFPPGSHRPWSSDQAALRFFTASLLYFDIISSTALERAPSLQAYHHHLLSPRKDEQAAGGGGCLELEPRLRLEEYFGCQSWVLQLIGEIAALDAWKKDARRAGSLSMTHLVSRAACLELALREGIACVDNQCPQLLTMGSDNLTTQHDTVDAAARIHTKIWAYAALTYLSTVVSGWQPSCPETVASVRATLDLLNRLRSPVCLRTAVWPFCVIGCLADPHQESMFRDMAARMGPLEVFGSLTAAIGVMENVWARRDTIDESWDLAACFKVLGHPVLLT